MSRSFVVLLLAVTVLGAACGETEETSPGVSRAGNAGMGPASGGAAGTSVADSSTVGFSGSGVGFAIPDAAFDATDGPETDVADACPAADADWADASGTAVCTVIAQLPCRQGLDLIACEAEVQTSFDGVPTCCVPLLRQLFACGIEHGLRCANLSDDVLFTPACASIEESWDRCSGSIDNCTERGGHDEADGGPSCEVECDQYAADCFRRDAGVFECTCTFGPHLGDVFIAADCALNNVSTHCK